MTHLAFFTSLSSQTVILLKKAKYFMKASLTNDARSFHCGHATDPRADRSSSSCSYVAPFSPLAFPSYSHNQCQHSKLTV